MSCSMWSIDCLALHIDKKYFDALRKEFKKGVNLLEKANYNDEMIYALMDDDYDSFIDELLYNDIVQCYDSENYAQYWTLDLKTGEMHDKKDFNGYVVPISYGSSSIYLPEFKSKEDLIAEIKKHIYIPEDFELQGNVIFLTGIQGG